MIEFDPTTSLPKRIENYEIVELLGEGAMGYVFRARDPDLKIDFALKMLKRDVAADASARERFLREAQAAAALNHDHIVPVHRVRDIVIGDQHYPYLVMPLLKGETLADRIARAKDDPISLDEQRTIGEHIARGLSAAHEAGLVHRDIKPANIWLESRKEGLRAKILDFGLARSLSEAMTATDVMMGSPAYMSPEQWKSSKVDHRADLWSLGVILYEMATGRRPFRGDTVFVLMTSVANDEIEAVRRLNPAIPHDYARVIEQLLIKQSERRLSPADVVVAHLKRESPSLSETQTFVVPIRRRRPLAIGLLLMLLMLNIALVAWWMNRGSKELTPTVVDPTKWEEKRPALLTGDLTDEQLTRLRREWATFYGVEPEYSVDLGDGVKLEMVFIPPGTFWMGSQPSEIRDVLKQAPDLDRKSLMHEEPPHVVTISEGFYIGKYEITQEQYKAVVGSNPSYFQIGEQGADKVLNQDTKRFPVETVSWDDAQSFVTSLNDITKTNDRHRVCRLPREAEWEYVCRAGQFSKDSLPFHTGKGQQKSLGSSDANFDSTPPNGVAPKGTWLQRTARVGSYSPNRFGVFDMHGNVWEWCEDWYAERYYAVSPQRDPVGSVKGKERVIRGGGWNYFGWDCRASARYWFDPTNLTGDIGFRVVATIAPATK